MRIASLVLCVLSGLVCTQTRADEPVPAPEKSPAAQTPPAKKPAAAKPGKPSAASDEEEPAPKSAPRRFVPTDKGKADEDIPFPVDI
jgi:hypothetical protein